MGFYVRKSISVGPFRFGLSKSGVNVSAGVKGFRVGTGPRGNYVHMGLGGIYYRTTLPRNQGTGRPTAGPQSVSSVPPQTGQGARPLGQVLPNPLPPTPARPPPSLTPQMNDIDSASAADIIDSSSADLLNEINTKQKKIRLWPVALVLSVIAALTALVYWPAWAAGTAALLGAIVVFFAHQRDALTKTVVLFYDMDPTLEKAYEAFHQWALQMAGCANVWHVEAQGKAADTKYNAGATHVVRRNPTHIRRSQPPYVKTNVDTVAVGVGAQTLHFFPDRLLIFDARGVGAVSYARLQLIAGATRFVEDGAVPRDATVVDRTWKYVNKKGGADKRFKDNRQLPVCLYDELSIRSESGLNELLQLSRRNVVDGFIQAVRDLAARLPADSR